MPKAMARGSHLDEPEGPARVLEVAKKPRPRFLVGYTFYHRNPAGQGIYHDQRKFGHQPFEVFINTAKAGSDTAAVSEAIGRMISRAAHLLAGGTAERMQEVIRQLAGIGGGRSLGFGPKRVRSLPDGLAQVLNEYVLQRNARLNVGAMISEQAGATPVKPTEQWSHPGSERNRAQ